MLELSRKNKPLSEIVETFINGGTPSTRNQEFWGGDIPWITAADIKNFRVSTGRKNITKAGVNDGSTHLVPAARALRCC
jgi:type I restriction enzyme, S subunit